VSIASNPVVAKKLKIQKSMPYWEVKHIVLINFGESLFAEIKRLGSMDWQDLAKDYWASLGNMAGGTGKQKFLKYTKNLFIRHGDLKKLPKNQKQELKTIIREMQAEWISCLPKTN
jgi:hypothetical protein